ncbi:Adagio protein 1-like [Mycena chlorophos]|uniref:Adagio protein 1-like n=1 Tax=Mycena chlorophos TaxID=658473 RepID=A0A8H6TVQ5_MYCCL|nr:Adagio protein 1-like [Mycena chlorophos]
MTLPLLYIALLISAVHAAFSPPPRWGQATSIITSSLFVQGGKQDSTNSQSYTGADAQGDLLLLSLEYSFSVDSPPWQFVSNPANESQSHGPAVAWHTMSVFNETFQLIFGGDPTPTASSFTDPDSAWLLDMLDHAAPEFEDEPSNWDGEPIRRIHHTAVTSISGEVYIFGGEKADDSGILFSDNYVFSPFAGTFTPLPTAGAPPAMTGHGAVILENEQVWLFGGLSADGLLSFETFYIFDTTTNTWSTQNTVSANVPAPRRAFAFVLYEDIILIQGGSDRNFLNFFADGWIYNITDSTWTQIEILAEIGPRRDHFAVYYGGQIIMGFGYGAYAPANTSIIVYDPSSQTFSPTYNAPPVTATISATIPLPSVTLSNTFTSHPFSGTISSSVHPTSTNGHSGGGSGSGSGKPSQKKITTIAVGAVVGVLAFVAAGLAVVWLIRRHERKRWLEGGVGGDFAPLNGAEGGGGPTAVHMSDAPPEHAGGVAGAVNTVGAAVSSWAGWVAGGLGLAGAAAVTQDRKERRDMLADEDTRDFGYGDWYDVGDNRSSRSRLRQTSGGSTWSLSNIFRPKARREASAASGLSYGESLLAVPDEKDPFRDEMNVAGGRMKRPGPGRRQSSFTSYVSVASTQSGYLDPFADPLALSERDIATPGALLAAVRPTMLSPVTEVSRSSGSASSMDHNTSSSLITPFDSLSRASTFGMSSNQSHLNSPFGQSSPAPGSSKQQPRASSILDMRPQQPDQPMRRSDTWWARFAGKSLLDRRSSRGASTSRAPMEFRDPTPLPARLGFVQEETASVMADSHRSSSDGSQKQPSPSNTRSGGPFARMSHHGKSMSSIQTADSAALERMGDVGVMLRGNRQSASTSTRGSENTNSGDDGQFRTSWHPPEQDENDIIFTASPVEMVPASAFALSPSPPPAAHQVPLPSSLPASSKHSLASTPPASIRPPLSTASSGSSSNASVADRVKAYERRMSQDVTSMQPPTTPPPPKKKTHKHGASYGLIARPNLFVANPGPNRETSGGSQSAA